MAINQHYWMAAGSVCVRARPSGLQPPSHFDPESGVVTVYEGRREFKALERAARKAGLPKGRVREYLPYRMLEVEVAANAVYNWAAQQILARRLSEERPSDPIQYAASVHHEAQALCRLDRALSDFKRYRAGRNQPVHLQGRRHVELMRAFLDEEVFDGQVRVGPEPRPRRQHTQATLLEDQ